MLFDYRNEGTYVANASIYTVYTTVVNCLTVLTNQFAKYYQSFALHVWACNKETA